MMRLNTPLAWPEGKPRTPPRLRRPSPYGPVEAGRRRLWTWDEAITQICAQMTGLGVEHWQVSIDASVKYGVREAPIRHDPIDPGVVVTFVLDGRVYLLACDQWFRVEDNLHACALYIEWQRRIARCGAGTIRQTLQGHLALPAQAIPRKILGKPTAPITGARKGITRVVAGFVRLASVLAVMWILLTISACDQIRHF